MCSFYILKVIHCGFDTFHKYPSARDFFAFPYDWAINLFIYFPPPKSRAISYRHHAIAHFNCRVLVWRIFFLFSQKARENSQNCMRARQRRLRQWEKRKSFLAMQTRKGNFLGDIPVAHVRSSGGEKIFIRDIFRKF